MAAQPIVEAIIAGTTSMDDVVRWNVERMGRWIASPGHSPERCRNKNCIHGARDIDVEHRNTIAREAGIAWTG